VNRLSRTVTLQLESALEYVSLRQDLPETSRDLLLPVGGAALPGRDRYEGVFRWLRDVQKVKKIFKVVVDDLVPYPHTDRAIIAALEKFDVEIWDWRKLDISSETVFKAASGTRQLHLQCSGNEAVLRSWSCKHGLARLTEVIRILL
jgi:hypothetical protein